MPAASFQTPEHYLLYASSGRMRLEADRKSWTLPPARAALVAADHPVVVTLPRQVVANCAKFATTFVSRPPSPLSVFEVTPLVRELLLECRHYSSPDQPLDDYGIALFGALWAACHRLAQMPTSTVMPTPQSDMMARALKLLESDVCTAPTLEQLAGQLGTTPRSLARRFRGELTMTYRESLRRLRMIRAVELLVDNASRSMTEIALLVGYDSLSAFNSAFRDFAAMSPSAYRHSLRSADFPTTRP